MKRAIVMMCVLAACGPNARHGGGGDDDGSGGDGGTKICPVCTEDKSGVVDCEGNISTCPDQMACSNGACMNACAAAEANHESVGCDYYAVDMDAAQGPPQDACFTMFVANTSNSIVHMQVEWGGSQLDLSRFAKLPVGAGTSLSYAAYDPTAGLAPGKVAIVFLAYATGLMNVSCPVPAAVGTDAQIAGTGFGKAFHLTTDNPVVAYQMLPYGGGRAAATGASLLLPSSAWDKNYVVVTAYDTGGTPPPISFGMGPSFNIVAKEDNTTVTMRPKSAVLAGAGLQAGAANQPYTFTLNKGQYAQFTQMAQMSGSPVQSDKPIGVFGGHQIMSIDRCCGDHGEQMLAPVRAVGSEYVAAPHAQRKPGSDPRIYRIFGTVDGTNLTYDPPNLGPSSLGLGGWVEIRTETPFVVHSQDSAHPVEMFTYMSGAGEQGEGGFGDADFVRLPPPAQFLAHYVFFTDPTYPFTVLTVVRKKHEGTMEDVTLDCVGSVTGWTPVGSTGEYEIAYVKLVDHFNAVGACNNGVHVMDSKGGFGVWVWGWGSEDTNTGWVSYGYPAGEGVLPINDVVILSTPQ
jgi:hypothetical protein